VNSNEVPNFITNKEFRAGLEAMGIPLAVDKVTLRGLEDFERTEFHVDKNTKPYWVAEVEWIETGDSFFHWSSCSKKVLIPLSRDEDA